MSSCDFQGKCIIRLRCIDWKDIENFTWDEYLNQTKSQAVPNRAFKLVTKLFLTDNCKILKMSCHCQVNEVIIDHFCL
jgi:hypothetical protein